jgi:hypothetical protein
MNMEAPARAVSWNNLKSNLLAVGLFNGKILIIDVEKYQVK